MLELLNRNAASIQAIGSVLAIFVAIGIPWWQTHVSRCDQAAARRRAARVLAMELLPTVKAMHADLARALQMGWNDPNHIDTHVLQERRIGAPEVLEGALNRLAVLDEETIRRSSACCRGYVNIIAFNQ